MEGIKGFGTLFYLVDPAKFTADKIEDAPNFSAQAIPYVFLLGLIEAGLFFFSLLLFSHFPSILSLIVIGLLRRRQVYNTVDTITSLSFGLVQFLTDLLLRSLLNIPYVYVYTYWRIFSIPSDSIYTYILLIFGVDLSYYWMHRTAHEYHTLWIGHSVHHSGEYYNLATALRQGIIQSFYSKLFHLPLALLGFPCGAWSAHNQINTLYQFWIHTEQVSVSSSPLLFSVLLFQISSNLILNLFRLESLVFLRWFSTLLLIIECIIVLLVIVIMVDF